MFVVHDKNICRIIDYDDFYVLDLLYTSFLGIDVFSSWYPTAFLRTLEFKNNVCEISDADIQKLFCKWCILKGKSFCNSVKTHGYNIYNNLRNKYLKKPSTEETITDPVDEESEDVGCETKDIPPVTEDVQDKTPIEQEAKGVPVFNKKKLYSMPVFFEQLVPDEEQKLDKTYNNDIKDSMLMVCYSVNKKNEVTFFDSCDVFMLKELDRIGLKDVKINFAMFLPDEDIVEELAAYYALDEPHDMQHNMGSILKLVKFVNSEKKVSVLVKSVLEFFFNTFEFDINASTKLNDVFVEYYKYNTHNFRFSLNAVIDIDTFVDILKYLYMYIDNNNLMYYKLRKEPLKMKLDFDKKLETMLKTPYIHQKTHQLRKEPQCYPLSNISPWGLSSHLEYATSESLFPNKSLNI